MVVIAKTLTGILLFMPCITFLYYVFSPILYFKFQNMNIIIRKIKITKINSNMTSISESG